MSNAHGAVEDLSSLCGQALEEVVGSGRVADVEHGGRDAGVVSREFGHCAFNRVAEVDAAPCAAADRLAKPVLQNGSNVFGSRRVITDLEPLPNALCGARRG